ncbi:lytic polysaccharide monooxygenase [Myriangium duriaei CBS 260.36]|uniref:Lytic polysaccharide monooxygenase n=1 Tax=Myriangium duriaei CBS 260.36 TaxID=1168546 RepID=A0A9P4J969_9PEZI|nr:lytic polysaccharide monooxygenase [Myriangium duriaei CBS 260.36]
MSIVTYASLLAATASTAYAHGFVSGLRSDGAFYSGYNPSFQYQNPPPVVAGWSDPADLSNGFIAPSAAGTADVICHLNATNAKTSMPVVAGKNVDFLWTAWPASHKGPVITWLAKCPDTCETVDKTTLEFFKIDEVGLISASQAQNGYWASDAMIANNNTWTSTIPASLAPGNYVARHETIALHSAGTADGAQIYPQCINLKITGSGTEQPSGVLGTALYNTNSPGMIFNLYNNTQTYTVPGPDVPAAFSANSGAGMGSKGSSGSTPTSSGSGSSSTAAPTSSSSPITTAPAATPSATTTAQAQTTTSAAASVDTLTSVVMQTQTTMDCATVTVHASGTSAVPTTIVTSVRPASAPTGTSGSGSGSATSAAGSHQPLPSGTNLKDLVSWLDAVLDDYYGASNARKARRSLAHLRRQL